VSTDLSVLYPSAAPPVEAGAAGTATKVAPAAGDAKKGESADAKPADPGVQALVDSTRRLLSGVRWSEPVPGSVADYAALFPGRVPADAVEERQQALAACLKMGVGVTQLGAAVTLARETLAPGYSPPSLDHCLEVLRTAWGDDVEVKVALARRFARQIAQAWPGFFPFLERNQLGSHPAMVQLLYEKATRAARR
jgi:hypothetical protein